MFCILVHIACYAIKIYCRCNKYSFLHRISTCSFQIYLKKILIGRKCIIFSTKCLKIWSNCHRAEKYLFAMVLKQSLHIASWNVNGFKCKGFNKYSDPRFIDEIIHKDIFCLLETHCSLEDSLCLPGFKCIHLIRPKSKGTYKRSGGISVYVKDDIRPGIKFLEYQNNDYIWLKLNKDFFQTYKDIFLCFLYNPPSGSTYTQSLDEDIFDLIETDIAKFSEVGSIILAGDFNARTGNVEQDFILNDNIHNDISLFENYTPDMNLPVRYCSDTTSLTRGRALNAMCIQSGLRILNGRTVGDFLGQYTCHTPRGSSVVDYTLVSESLFKNMSFFKVHKFLGDLSDPGIVRYH